MNIKFIKKHINEGYFRNPEQMKNAAEKRKNKVSGELVSSIAKKEIGSIASSRFDTEFKEYLTGVNGIFEKDIIDVDNLLFRYYFDNNILICEFPITLVKPRGYFGWNYTIEVKYPENIREMENSLKEEYGVESKVKIISDLGPHIKDEIYFSITNCDDLTEFCHFMNCIEGLDLENYRLIISTTGGYTSLDSVHTDEPLKTKFGGARLVGFEIGEVDNIEELITLDTNTFIKREAMMQRLAYDVNWKNLRKNAIGSIAPSISGKYTSVIRLDSYGQGNSPKHEKQWSKHSYSVTDTVKLINSVIDWAHTKGSALDNVLICIIPQMYYYNKGEGAKSIQKDLEKYKTEKRRVPLKDNDTGVSIYLGFDATAKYGGVDGCNAYIANKYEREA